MVTSERLLSRLFMVFLQLGFFVFGGGWAMIPLIERELVQRKKWLTKDQFIDNLCVVQVLPGAVAVNLALTIGYNLAGWPGLIVAGLGVVLPSVIVIVVIAQAYSFLQTLPLVVAFFAGVRPVVVGLIVAAALRVGGQVWRSWRGWLLSFSVFVAVTFARVNPIYALISAALVGLAWKGRPSTDHAEHGLPGGE